MNKVLDYYMRAHNESQCLIEYRKTNGGQAWRVSIAHDGLLKAGEWQPTVSLAVMTMAGATTGLLEGKE